MASDDVDEAIVEQRWWTLAELQHSTALVFPPGFARLVGPVMQGRVPAEPPAI